LKDLLSDFDIARSEELKGRGRPSAFLINSGQDEAHLAAHLFFSLVGADPCTVFMVVQGLTPKCKLSFQIDESGMPST
jgi:hypothetical protein